MDKKRLRKLAGINELAGDPVDWGADPEDTFNHEAGKFLAAANRFHSEVIKNKTHGGSHAELEELLYTLVAKLDAIVR